MNFGLLFDALNKHDVKYVVCGGLAVNLHGVPRMTADIDIILEMNQENLLRFEKCSSSLNYRVSVPVKISDLSDEVTRRKLIESKHLVAISYFNFDKNLLALDVVIDFPIPFNQLWESRIVKTEGSLVVNVVSIEHLIALKEFSNRAQDKQDVYYLSKIKYGK